MKKIFAANIDCDLYDSYKLVLPFTNKLYLTHIHKKFHGDTWFPNLCLSNWEVIEEEAHKNEDIQIEYTYKTYSRISE